jgi:large repetitive protein
VFSSFLIQQPLTALQVTPNPAGLVINSLLGQQPVQLAVTGLLSDASTVDLTAAANTVYQSLAPSIALVDDVGKVAGVSTGTATINVTNGNRSAQAVINVVSFSPSLMSFIQLAGQANNVDVSGNLAYVAVGTAGVQIVDVTDRRDPHILTTFDTVGNANDIRVIGNLAHSTQGIRNRKGWERTGNARKLLVAATI